MEMEKARVERAVAQVEQVVHEIRKHYGSLGDINLNGNNANGNAVNLTNTLVITHTIPLELVSNRASGPPYTLQNPWGGNFQIDDNRPGGGRNCPANPVDMRDPARKQSFSARKQSFCIMLDGLPRGACVELATRLTANPDDNSPSGYGLFDGPDPALPSSIGINGVPVRFPVQVATAMTRCNRNNNTNSIAIPFRLRCMGCGL